VHHFGLPMVSGLVAREEEDIDELTRRNRFLKVLDGLLLGAEARALLVMKPAQLLKDLCVIRVAFENARVGRLGRVVLCNISGMTW